MLAGNDTLNLNIKKFAFNPRTKAKNKIKTKLKAKFCSIVRRGVKTAPPISKATPSFWVTPPFLKIPDPPPPLPPLSK